MALFTVNRYLGEDESDLVTETPTDDVLAQLKSRALKRKAEREVEEEKKKKKKKTKKRKLEKREENEEIIQEESNDATGYPSSLGGTREIEESTVTEPSASTEAVESLSNNREVGGFTVLSPSDWIQRSVVERVLPEWLSKPSVVAVNLDEGKTPIGDEALIDERLRQSLQENGVRYFFPVQRQVVPFLLGSLHPGTLYLEPGFLRPNDICVSAPTGSGKTLAYVVPILQALSQRVVPAVRALVVLPVKDLALQVFRVFSIHAACLGLKVGLAVSGHQTMEKERKALVWQLRSGTYSKVDILVATPGRLVDHLQTTPGFSLSKLRFLVIDEADRMMQDIKQDWLEAVEESAKRDREIVSHEDALCLGGLNKPMKPVYPLQKLLFSATLSQNPEKLEALRLFQPKLFTSVQPKKSGATESEISAPREGQFLGKYTTPKGLAEYTCFVKNPSLKPLIFLYFMTRLKFKRVLLFTKTKENARKLLHLSKGFGGFSVREFSSALSPLKRERIIRQFDAEKLDVVVCTDAMARGMDLPGVKWVISYDCPAFVKTYVHRVGRTARAGRAGSAITLLEENQKAHFAGMMEEAGKDEKAMHRVRADEEELEPYFERYELALEYLKEQMRLKELKKNSKNKHT